MYLSKIRKSKKMSQSQLAKLSGVSIRMIQYYEQGLRDINKAEVITIYKLAVALGCKVEDIIKLEDQNGI